MKYKYQSDGWRPELSGKVIDIGGADSFGHGQLDAIIDIRQPQASANKIFVGDIDQPYIWDDVLEHAAVNGKWDYAICTHTLEDINNPFYACRMIELIAKRGLIIIPSKYRELSRFSDPYFRGYIHHRWIYDVQDGKFIAFPKINYIEHPYFDKACDMLPGRDELVIEWEDKINLCQLNDGIPYGTETLSGDEHIKSLYKTLLNETN